MSGVGPGVYRRRGKLERFIVVLILLTIIKVFRFDAPEEGGMRGHLFIEICNKLLSHMTLAEVFSQ
jgi:hypothetical protein